MKLNEVLTESTIDDAVEQTVKNLVAYFYKEGSSYRDAFFMPDDKQVMRETHAALMPLTRQIASEVKRRLNDQVERTGKQIQY